jgi:hypothetical protein
MGDPNHPLPDTPEPPKPQPPVEPGEEPPQPPHPVPAEAIKLRARRRVVMFH